MCKKSLTHMVFAGVQGGPENLFNKINKIQLGFVWNYQTEK